MPWLLLGAAGVSGFGGGLPLLAAHARIELAPPWTAGANLEIVQPLTLSSGFRTPSPSLVATGEWHPWATPGDLYVTAGAGAVVWMEGSRAFPAPVGALGVGYRYVTAHRWCWGFESVARIAGHDANDHRMTFSLGASWGVSPQDRPHKVRPGVGVPIVVVAVPVAFVLGATAASGGTLF